jgi:hypothetical protein
MIESIVLASVQALTIILQLAARSGVDPATLEVAKQEALAAMQAIKTAEVAQEAKEWNLARGIV